MSKFQPIEAEYKGYHFRSLLEVRWAVFFDHLQIKWEYERQGFETSSGNYQPDFWLHSIWPSHRPGSVYWVEIKPFEPDANEVAKLRELSIETQHNAFTFLGNSKKW